MKKSLNIEFGKIKMSCNDRCHDGWEGDDCSKCLPLPGCLNGGCKDGQPDTCECHEGYEGTLCDQPKCSEGCDELHGYCEEVIMTFSNNEQLCNVLGNVIIAQVGKEI